MAAAPTMTTTKINTTQSDTTAYANDTLMEWCNASDTDGDNVSYYYKQYLNDVLNSSGDESRQSWVKQQDANAYENNSGYWSSVELVVDGDEATAGRSNHGVVVAYLNMNYTKKQFSSSDTFWFNVWGWSANRYTHTNAFSSFSNCWNQSSTTLELRVRALDATNDWNSWECYNGTDWETVAFNNNTGLDDVSIKEEYINWSITKDSHSNGILINVDNTSNLIKGQNWTFSCLATDGTSNSSWLNSSTLTISNFVPVIVNEISFTNCSTGHCFNITSGIIDVDGFRDISNITVNVSNGTCDYLSNSSSTNYFNATFNCSGTSLVYAYVNMTFKDSSDAVVITSTVGNTYPNNIPIVDNVTISPSPANSSVDLNCTYDYSDGDSDAITDYFNWTINSVLSSTHTQILAIGNTSSNDNITCSVKVSDGYQNSTWDTSPLVNLGDTDAPIIYNVSISETSGYTDTTHYVYVNCSDALSGLATGYPKISYTDPNSTEQGNFTMSLVTNTTDKYQYANTFGVIGLYTDFKFYCMDAQSNLASNLTNNITYTSSVRPVADGGGSGGRDEPLCSINIVKPTISLNVIGVTGNKGNVSPWQSIVLQNMEDYDNTYTFSLENDVCELEDTAIAIKGNSQGLTRIRCTFPEQNTQTNLLVRCRESSLELRINLFSDLLSRLFSNPGLLIGLIVAIFTLIGLLAMTIRSITR